MPITIVEAQQMADRWIREHGGYWDDFVILARLTEELGEIASDLQRDRSFRPRKVKTDLPAEVGDLFFTLCAFANKNNIDISVAFQDVIRKYTERDSAAWKEAERSGGVGKREE